MPIDDDTEFERVFLRCENAPLATLKKNFSSVTPSSMNVAVAVLSGTNVIPVFLGSALAYFVSGTFSEGIVQLCAILVIGAVRLVMPSADHKEDPVFVSLLTTGAMLLFSCVMSVAMPSDTYIKYSCENSVYSCEIKNTASVSLTFYGQCNKNNTASHERAYHSQ